MMIPRVSDAIRRLKLAREFSDSGILLLSRIVQNGLGFALSLAIVRKFGVAGVGSLTVASVGIVLQATVLTFGMHYVLAQSELTLQQRNRLSAVLCLVAFSISVPISGAMGLCFGRDADESLVISLLCLAGPYFAQTSVAESLLVLQGRLPRIALSTAGHLLGLGFAYLATDSFAMFAASLAAGRILGVALIYVGLPMEACSTRALWSHLRHGSKFVFPDAMGLVADQLSIAVVSGLTNRAELGVFGLCRQLLTVGDTPLYSRLVASYPKVCRDLGSLRQLESQMLVRGLAAGALLAALAPVLAIFVYGTRDLAWMGPLMMLCVPLRYAASTAELGLRAAGEIAAVQRLNLARIGLVCLLPIGIHFAGLAGVGIAFVVQTCAVALLARRFASRLPSAGSDPRPQKPDLAAEELLPLKCDL
jgi:O-antigen/teichoic acid export membrane protein